MGKKTAQGNIRCLGFSESMSSSKLYITPRCWKQLVRKMPIPCVDTIVYRGARVLLGWRTILPYRNVWALLGGRMLYGESFEDTSKRNCKESGLTVHQPEYLGIFPIKFPSGRHDLVLCMSAKYIRGEPRPTRELSKYVWTTKDAADEIHPIGGNYLKMLRRWRKGQNF